MAEKTSIKKNAFYNIIKSLLAIVFPLITYPYAVRVLGVVNLGKVTYAASIVSYFSLLAVFGVNSYAIREGARVKDDRKRFGKIASELFTLNLLTMLISLVLLALVTAAVPKFRPYALLIAIQSLSFVFTTFGVDWMNVVYEDYRYITIRSALINVLFLGALLLLVRQKSDYLIYAFLTVAGNGCIAILNFFYCRRYTRLRIALSPELKTHVDHLWPFFINNLTIAIYVSSDTTMLGWMAGDYAVGIYAIGVKIYTIIKNLFIAVYSVTLPKLSFSSARGDWKQFREVLRDLLSFFILLIVPAVAGMIFFARDIVLIIGGPQYEEAVPVFRILSIALLFAVFGGVVTRCINIPLGLEKNNAKATIFAAVENIVLNIPCIWMFRQIGAASTTALAELTVLAYCIWKLPRDREKLGGLIVGRDILHAFIGGIMVAAARFLSDLLFVNNILHLACGICLTGIGYLAALLLLRNPLIMGSLSGIRRRFKRR